MNNANYFLPIYEKHDEIVNAIRSRQVVVIAGQTGSGKTTQLPFFCLEAGRGRAGRIGCTQPRRIAATSIAARVAQQAECEVGDFVGYKIRFAEKTSPRTCVKFMTDGILLAEAEHDRMFTQYDTIIIDEAHERSLNIDFLLGYLRKLLPQRRDLKVIISSATIDAQKFSENFDNAPIIEVSGRLFPIDLLYKNDAPEKRDEDSDSESYVDDALDAAFYLLDNFGAGDMLVFMPTERDIRETCEKIKARNPYVSALPLFSRLTRGEQDAIFNPTGNVRIIVCTNIAETSITVPNIRYVVDTGLARMLRYAPRLRTNRLPIEPISRASADQRMGRCGRVRDGVCIRLYSETDFNAREEFTQPEIKRSNLAGVILTMTAHNLGNIEDFPFIEPPSKQAVSEGYTQLKELGALDKQKKLTPLGREMSRLPFDPHISRMIIAAKKEGALRDVKIIAAGLSIVDPRERPLDKQAEADAMHAKFVDKSSDFLTYINLWNAYQNVWETLNTQGAIRRFCKEHFLSYTRMREWHDVHQQLDDVLSNIERVEQERKLRDELRASQSSQSSHVQSMQGRPMQMSSPQMHSSSMQSSSTLSSSIHSSSTQQSSSTQPSSPTQSSSTQPSSSAQSSSTQSTQTQASSDAIHRSLITGLLANCAHLDKLGKYKSAGGKELYIYPGSALARNKRDSKSGKEREAKIEWIMCHEIVETSRVFARTVAAIKPEWLEELAADFCKRTYDAPFFDAETGCVRATERITLFGMPLAVRRNALYSKVDPERAAQIFISDALVDEQLVAFYPFFEHNKKVKERILLAEDKLRSRAYYSGDDAMFDFYAERLPNVASIHDLNKAVKEAGGDGFLFMKDEDILNAAIPSDAENFPDHVNIGNQNFALRYAFEPGADHDGVTLALPQKVLPFVDKETLGWLLPALWPDRIKSLLQNLPRAQRKVFIPMNEAAQRLADSLDSGDGSSFAVALARAIKNIYKIDVDPAMLDADKTDAHLDLKIEVRGDDDNIIAAGRGTDVFKKISDTQTGEHQSDINPSPWNETFASYRKKNLVSWPSDDLNTPIDIGSHEDGLPVRGFPALVVNSGRYGDDRDEEYSYHNDETAVGTVDLVYLPSKLKSDIAHRGGVRRLLELSLEKDLAWTYRDITISPQTKIMCAPFDTADTFKDALYNMICESVLDFDDAPRSLESFYKLISARKESLRGVGFRALSVFEESLRIFTDNAARLASIKKKLPPDIAEELSNYLDAHFTDIIDGEVTLEIFLQYPRYLKLFTAMTEKASFEPFKYRQKRAEVDHYISIYNDLREKNPPDENRHLRARHLKTFAQMIREYEVNIFAQHIKTLYPVSVKRLDKLVEEIKNL